METNVLSEFLAEIGRILDEYHQDNFMFPSCSVSASGFSLCAKVSEHRIGRRDEGFLMRLLTITHISLGGVREEMFQQFLDTTTDLCRVKNFPFVSSQ